MTAFLHDGGYEEMAEDARLQKIKTAIRRRAHHILETCETLHMMANGSMDAPPEEGDPLYLWLLERVTNWRPSLPAMRQYDDLVWALAVRALDEYRGSRGAEAAELPRVI